jgi:hypothetical protein
MFVGSLAGLLCRSTRGKARKYAWTSALATILASGVLSFEQNYEAHRLGLIDDDDRRAATAKEV